jgi:hypothetical protein
LTSVEYTLLESSKNQFHITPTVTVREFNSQSPPYAMSEEQVEHGHGESYSPSEIERLGRERPEAFKSSWVEVGFCFSLLGSMFVAEYFISGFNVLLPSVTNTLHIPPQAATWPASVFSLVAGAFLLPFGRLSDIFGGKAVFVSGLIWFLIWSLIAGFSQNYIMLIFCRALQGFGPAAYLVSGIMLLGNMVRLPCLLSEA